MGETMRVVCLSPHSPGGSGTRSPRSAMDMFAFEQHPFVVSPRSVCSGMLDTLQHERDRNRRKRDALHEGRAPNDNNSKDRTQDHWAMNILREKAVLHESLRCVAEQLAQKTFECETLRKQVDQLRDRLSTQKRRTRGDASSMPEQREDTSLSQTSISSPTTGASSVFHDRRHRDGKTLNSSQLPGKTLDLDALNASSSSVHELERERPMIIASRPKLTLSRKKRRPVKGRGDRTIHVPVASEPVVVTKIQPVQTTDAALVEASEQQNQLLPGPYRSLVLHSPRPTLGMMNAMACGLPFVSFNPMMMMSTAEGGFICPVGTPSLNAMWTSNQPKSFLRGSGLYQGEKPRLQLVIGDEPSTQRQEQHFSEPSENSTCSLATLAGSTAMIPAGLAFSPQPTKYDDSSAQGEEMVSPAASTEQVPLEHSFTFPIMTTLQPSTLYWRGPTMATMSPWRTTVNTPPSSSSISLPASLGGLPGPAEERVSNRFFPVFRMG